MRREQHKKEMANHLNF